MTTPGRQVRAGPTVSAELLDDLDQRLTATDDFLARSYPGEDGRRQPLHTVYAPADRYATDLPQRWGRAAHTILAAQGGLHRLAADLGLAGELAETVVDRVTRKLEREPIEDLRIDFEDGYGSRPDEVEDAEAVRAARELGAAVRTGQAPAFVGLRFKCFEARTRRRGIRTLDLFLSTLLGEGELPEGLRITFPKVSTVSQVEAMVALCEAFEREAGLPTGRLRFEIQVETPQLILGADGRATIAAVLHAGRGRVTSLHYGTYDYSASLGVSAAYQSLAHPAADYAKSVMQAAVAGTGVQLADGSTNILPLGSEADIRAAWLLHYALVRRGLERAYYQGWDLHPHQLPTRFLANFAFFREGFVAAGGRLADYVARSGSAIVDEPATARALARYLHRGYLCGALDEHEIIGAARLTPSQLGVLARSRSDTEHLTLSA